MHRFQSRKKKEPEQALTEQRDEAKEEREETSLREYIMALEERIRGDIDEARQMNESTARSMAEQIKRLEDELQRKTEHQKAEGNREIDLLEKRLQEGQAELNTLRSQNQTLTIQCRQLEGELQEKAKQQAGLGDALITVQKDLDSMREHSEMLGEQNAELETELQKHQSDMKAWKEAVASSREEVGRLEEEKRKAEEEIYVVRKDIQVLAEQSTRLKEELLEKQQFQIREWNQLKEKHKDAEEEISFIRKQNIQLQSDLEKARRHRAQVSQDIDGEVLMQKVVERMTAVEDVVRQMTADFQAEAQERKVAEKQSVDWTSAKLREAELDNVMLRNENKTLTARMAGGQRMVELQTGLEDELKRVRDELDDVQQKYRALQHTQHQQEKGVHQTDLEKELKKIQEELATVQKQNGSMKNAQLENEKKAVERRTEVHRLRKGLEASKQREKQVQSDLEKAQMKHQTEIKKWVREVTSSKDENDALRHLVRQLEEENQSDLLRARAGAWRRERGNPARDTSRNAEEPSLWVGDANYPKYSTPKRIQVLRFIA